MKSLGICLGASTVSTVDVVRDKNSVKINTVFLKAHEGNPKKVLADRLNQLNNDEYHSIALTGRKFRQFVNIKSIAEPEAVELALDFINKDKKRFDAVISAGGETFMVYILDRDGKISTVKTGNKCASGTGEFFLQQIRRMGIDINSAVNLAKNGKPHKISGRCSVFCKSDCTHALNIGETKANVVSGLCKMIANKVSELLVNFNVKNAVLIGGVSQNKVVVDFLKEELPNIFIPKEATYFEALGTALWALNNKSELPKEIFKKEASNFDFHPALKDYTKMVEFKSMKKGIAKDNDECIIGLDVGSTTTKAILLRTKDNAVLCDTYLRTNGDPVGASRNCYRELAKQIKVKLNIIGLGVCGSGRQIAGLHALTNNIINEIIAHANAAVYFEKDVDTIFEIGGQDAKYTHITNSVPSDYAMNEACSAGTGSFLEESAKETLGIGVTKIGDIALKAKNPPNFNDQCAAFISSDIKNASHEGIPREDIVAGLVYSICMNYANRVKGNRPFGKKVFMQGGVCYNKAVPTAMSALIGKNIIVPPDPGLIGAFGVALDVKKKLNLGLTKKQKFDLNELADRNAEYEKSFKCSGGKEKCDRGCEINMIKINGKTYPFGGACNKYYNLRQNITKEGKDYVELRQKLVFEKYASLKSPENSKRIGINKSFLVNTLYPLYYNFFTKLGFKVILSKDVKGQGVDKRGAAFCYPAEIAHGLFQDLIEKKVDYIFLPHVKEIHVDKEEFYKKNYKFFPSLVKFSLRSNFINYKKTCTILQGEPYYLRTAFKFDKVPKILTPTLDFSEGFASEIDKFVKIAKELGTGASKAKEAYKFACEQQNKMMSEFKEIGKRALAALENEDFAVVLFGRPYNAFAKEANLGIPKKITTRGISVIPFDFLDYNDEENFENMYWGMGSAILRCAHIVKKNDKLFGTYITNFSCGPDSFLVGYFRDIMKTKPSLTLELDSHSADAGINTRVEAAIDIIKRYNQLKKSNKIQEKESDFKPATIVPEKRGFSIIDSYGKKNSLYDPNVELVIPSMGDLGSQALSAIFQGAGINSRALKPADYNILKIGRGNTSCKECLPLILTVGGLLDCVNKGQDKDKTTVYFMPTTHGPCRFGQYYVFMKNLIKKNKIKNTAILSLTTENDYGGFGIKFGIKAWKAIVVSDVFEDIKNTLRVLAIDKEVALDIFNQQWLRIIDHFKTNENNFYPLLKSVAHELSKIKLKKSIKEAKYISLTGEIYVRRDYFSRLNIIDKLAEKGFITRVAPVSEWIYYLVYLGKNRITDKRKITTKDKIGVKLVDLYLPYIEKKIKNILAQSGLIFNESVNIKKIMEHGEEFLSNELRGEAIVTIGGGLSEILSHHCCGVISLGPFGCMPSKIAEAILTRTMNLDDKIKATKDKSSKEKYSNLTELPFLAIETDGNLFPQVIEAKLETFMLQADRVFEKMTAPND